MAKDGSKFPAADSHKRQQATAYVVAHAKAFSGDTFRFANAGYASADVLISGYGAMQLTPSPNPDPGLVRESSCPVWGWKGFSDEEATQCRADRGLASAG